MRSIALPLHHLQAVRNEQYHNYYNLEEAVAAAQPAIDAAAVKPRPGARLFDFYRCAACLCACVCAGHHVRWGGLSLEVQGTGLCRGGRGRRVRR